MDDQVLYPTLTALAFALALNLKLTLSVLRASEQARAAPQLLPGQPVPSLTARMLLQPAPLQLAAHGQAWALLFLSSRCPKCRATLPQLGAMVEAARQAGLAMWIVSEEPPRRLRTFLGGTALQSCTARLNSKDYRKLNPSLSSPSYLFVSHEGILEAAGLIGDDDWRDLQAQLSGTDAALDQAA